MSLNAVDSGGPEDDPREKVGAQGEIDFSPFQEGNVVRRLHASISVQILLLFFNLMYIWL